MSGLVGFCDKDVQEFDEEDRVLIVNLKKRGRSSKASEGKPCYPFVSAKLASTEGPLPLKYAKPCLQPLPRAED